MTISRTVYNQLFEHSDSASTEHVIRLRPTEAKAGAHHLHAHQPGAIDTQTDFKHAPQPAQSPYGVADVYVKNGDNAAFTQQQQQQADGRLDMLARAMQLQTDAKPSAFTQPQSQAATTQEGSFISPPRSLSPVPVTASPSAPSSPGNSSLPSLAQILNLRGSAAAAAGATAASTRPGCNCNCSCSPSSSTKAQTGCHPSPPRQ
ncbi:hypothetical protein PybrP1_011646 [[Pythium] brassicae (nom. inval.)]|nr:hypothetical protein PybrP1_011646 [[Pythium] brassicae (nom. inval.)]